ncbi:hypothetical protein N665_0526s0006 [Sinapis alba]|nr:hypothetical protein N665_0526s0006 [Sinapis alba]
MSLCNSADETRDPLFFSCQFSSVIWSHFAYKLVMNLSPLSWTYTLQTLLTALMNRHWKFLILLAWQSKIYLSWRERNSRLHCNSFRDPISIIAKIKLLIKNRVSTLRDTNSDFSTKAMQILFS